MEGPLSEADHFFPANFPRKTNCRFDARTPDPKKVSSRRASFATRISTEAHPNTPKRRATPKAFPVSFPPHEEVKSPRSTLLCLAGVQFPSSSQFLLLLYPATPLLLARPDREKRPSGIQWPTSIVMARHGRNVPLRHGFRIFRPRHRPRRDYFKTSEHVNTNTGSISSARGNKIVTEFPAVLHLSFLTIIFPATFNSRTPARASISPKPSSAPFASAFIGSTAWPCAPCSLRRTQTTIRPAR